MKTTLLLALIVGCLVGTGCAGIPIAPVMPPPGLLISSYTAPLDTDVDKTDLGSKQGEASSYAILGLKRRGADDQARRLQGLQPDGPLQFVHHRRVRRLTRPVQEAVR